MYILPYITHKPWTLVGAAVAASTHGQVRGHHGVRPILALGLGISGIEGFRVLGCRVAGLGGRV